MSTPSTSSTPAPAGVAKQVHAVFDKHVSAMQSFDKEAYVALWTDEPVYMAPNTPIITNTAALRTAADAFLGQLKAAGAPVKVSFDLQYTVDANAAAAPEMVVAYGAQSIQIGDAPPMHSSGNAVLRKVGGEWKFAVVSVVNTTVALQKMHAQEV